MSRPFEIPVDYARAWAGPIDFLPLHEEGQTTNRERRQAELLDLMAREYYGTIPSPPDEIGVTRHPVPGENAERLEITISAGGRQFKVDAALWLPQDARGPAPLISGLDFLGPVGIMSSKGFPIDTRARLSSRPEYGAQDMRMEETLRGVSAYRWPVGMMLEAGYAVFVSCYGSWVPDHQEHWKSYGLYPFLECGKKSPVGAISLWAWAIQRLLDVAEKIDEIDHSRIAVAGHSRLGKTALWTTANDKRIGAVMACNSGCGGAAPAAHLVGETLEEMAENYPHWTILHPDGPTADRSFDQHHLHALVAPRAVYLATAKLDVKADPLGSYMALRKASDFWEPDTSSGWSWPSPQEIWKNGGPVRNGPLGYHMRPGGHNILPYDWRNFLEFLESQKADCE